MLLCAFCCDVLDLIHTPHPRILHKWKMAHLHYYWQGLTNNITQFIQWCADCQRHQPSQPIDNLMTSNVVAPMEQTSTDLFQVGNSHFLILVDCFSNFPFVTHCLSSNAISECLHSWFLVLFPRTIQMDEGRQFHSAFKDFCKKFTITHEISHCIMPVIIVWPNRLLRPIKYLMLHHPLEFEVSLSLLLNTCWAHLLLHFFSRDPCNLRSWYLLRFFH